MLLSSLVGGGGGVKSVQRGLTDTGPYTSVNITVTAVNMAKSFLTMPTAFGSQMTGYSVLMALTSATNIRITTGGTASQYPYVSWELVEFY